MFDYSVLIHRTSWNTVSAKPFESVIQKTAEDIVSVCGVHTATLSVRRVNDPSAGDITAVYHASAGSNNGARSTNQSQVPKFLFSRPLAVRNVTYGRIEVESQMGPGNPRLLMCALETVTTLLAMYVEQHGLRESVQDAEAQLQSEKLKARACGLIAKDHGISLAAAQRWLVEEAARTRRTLDELADRLILAKQAERYGWLSGQEPHRKSA